MRGQPQNAVLNVLLTFPKTDLAGSRPEFLKFQAKW